jgi:hypothetical protein
MKLYIEEKQTKELEISLPYFYKEDGYYCRILSENDFTKVAIINHSAWISKNDIVTVNPLKSEPITEQEFDEYMEKALELIQVKQVA